MGYRSDVVIQIETNNKETLKRIANEYSRLKIKCLEDAVEALECRGKWSDTKVYTFVVSFINVKFYESDSAVKELMTWLNLYSEIAKVGENTYGILSTQFIRFGSDYDDEECIKHGDVWNGIYLERRIDIEAEEKGIPINLD